MLLSEADALVQRRRDDETSIEAIMDSYTWDGFIDMLTAICHGKSEHVATNWQDRQAARNWDKVAAAFERARKLQPYS